ncbi:hypothetical protein R3W88_000951 [Solanum pinnatisectum]|uniref:Polyprotein protein n=1 Tax=Solanum pinnatisectum TaxID=50273 RepID=A0AAV9MJU1_9SOLN|nr:hypothetical protein R3W88_000951 [Solanum pinnatisectum]
MRVKICERGHGVTSKITALKAKVLDLRKVVDYLKSTNFTFLFESAEDQDAPTSFEMPPATTGDVPMEDVAADELEAEMDEEQLDALETTIYGDLPDLEEMIIQLVIQRSLTKTSMAGSSGATVAITPGTDALDQSDAPSIDAPIDGAIV